MHSWVESPRVRRWSRDQASRRVHLARSKGRSRRHVAQIVTVVAALVVVAAGLGCAIGQLAGEELGVTIGVTCGLWFALTGGAPWPPDDGQG